MASTEAPQGLAHFLSLMLTLPLAVVAADQTAIAVPRLPPMADQAVAAMLEMLAGILFLDKETLAGLGLECSQAVVGTNPLAVAAAVQVRLGQTRPAMSRAQVAPERYPLLLARA